MQTDPRPDSNAPSPRRRIRRKVVIGLIAVGLSTALGAAVLTAVQDEPAPRDLGTAGAQQSAREASNPSPAARFRLASFNLLGSGHTDGSNPRKGYDKSPVRLRRAVQVLADNKIDIVGFQEMHPSQQDLWNSLAAPTWRTYPLNTLSDSAGHNSIAWRNDTFVSVEKHTFPVPYFYGKPIQMPYVLLQHRFSGEKAWFVNVHNPADTFGDAEKYRVLATRAEITLVNRLRKENPRIPVFLTGDMNDRADFICPILRKTELQPALPGGYVSGTACTAPPASPIDWVTGTSDASFWGYESVRDDLVKATTDHPVIISNVDIPPVWLRTQGVRRVVVISIEGLRSRTISEPSAAALTPYLRSIRAKGAGTLNARTAYESVKPLPNAFSALSARPVRVDFGGHGVTTATDPKTPVHTLAGQYVSSVFDVVHNRGLSTSLYSSDPAASALVRAWDSANGGGDSYGYNNGRDKINTTVLASASDQAIIRRLNGDLKTKPAAFSFVQLGVLDRVGARYGYTSKQYKSALRGVDASIGSLIRTIKGNSALASNTLVLITSGSGGAKGNEATRLRYQVPLLAWGRGVQRGGDLYAMNPAWGDPGGARRNYSGRQPIFTGVIANLTLGALRMGALPRGVLNSHQNFTVFPR